MFLGAFPFLPVGAKLLLELGPVLSAAAVLPGDVVLQNKSVFVLKRRFTLTSGHDPHRRSQTCLHHHHQPRCGEEYEQNWHLTSGESWTAQLTCNCIILIFQAPIKTQCQPDQISDQQAGLRVPTFYLIVKEMLTFLSYASPDP